MEIVENRHPSFPNPTIAEALCEIHFGLNKKTKWNQVWYGKFYEKIREEFDTMEPKQVIDVNSILGPQGVAQAVSPPIIRMFYYHKKRHYLLQLSPDIFTVNEIKKYPGWNIFIEDIQNGWNQLCEVIKPDKVTRIGLRYINKIPRTESNRQLGEWLADTKYYPKHILSIDSNFLSRFEYNINPDHRVIVTVGQSLNSKEPVKPIVLDLDTILKTDLSANWSHLKAHINNLHEQIWEIFFSSITPRLKKYLEGQ